MQVPVLLFGITKDIVGERRITLEVEEGSNVAGLLTKLRAQYPGLEDVTSMLIAVNEEYASTDKILQSSDEIALIPPVSGG